MESVRKFKKTYSELPTRKYNDTVCLTDEQKGRTLGEYFQENFTNPQTYNAKQQEIINICNEIKNLGIQPVPTNLLTSPKEVVEVLKRFHNRRAPGSDDIPNILLKNLSMKAIVHLHYLINAIMKLQHYPESLKVANIVPIHKAGKNKGKVQNYRPISLVNGVAKIIDHILLSRLKT